MVAAVSGGAHCPLVGCLTSIPAVRPCPKDPAARCLGLSVTVCSGTFARVKLYFTTVRGRPVVLAVAAEAGRNRVMAAITRLTGRRLASCGSKPLSGRRENLLARTASFTGETEARLVIGGAYLFADYGIISFGLVRCVSAGGLRPLSRASRFRERCLGYRRYLLF